eukprot:c23595_g1_i1 orf=571-1167(-)
MGSSGTLGVLACEFLGFLGGGCWKCLPCSTLPPFPASKEGVPQMDSASASEGFLAGEQRLHRLQEGNRVDGVQLHCFSQQANDGILHFQILHLNKQLYIWIGCNSAKFGHLYTSMPTPFDRAPSLAVLIGGGADSTGASMARRLALRTGWSIFLACDLPKNSPILEADAEKRLMQELKTLGYVQPILKGQAKDSISLE